MGKFLLGLACGLVLAFLFGIILLFSLFRLSDRRPEIADNSVLLLRLEGDVPEKSEVEIPLPAFENQQKLTVQDMWSSLKRAAEDSRIKAVVIAPRHLSVGWAKLQEIHDSLASFRKSGKPVYAFLRFPGTRDYYVATAADKIYAAPDDMLDLKGLRVEAMYLRNTLNKLGIEMDVVHAGKYKDAYDMFTRTSMTPETREVLNQILDHYYLNLMETIAVGRKKDVAAVKALIDQGPFVAKDAMSNGLVDALGYEDQLMSDLQSRVKQTTLKRIETREYLRGLAPEPARARIALLVAEGVIMQGRGNEGFGSEEVTSGGFAKLVRQVKSDNSIKGVIVRVDSPGGDAIASDDILHEMQGLSRAKPVVISMSDVAASGGYFMSVTGDPIVAYGNTLTGSIGVITAKPNLHGLYDKLGISKELLTRGRFAALDSDYKPLDPAEKEKLAQTVDATYQGFISRVAAGRHRSAADIASIAEGRVWVGAQAKANGLVDQLGGLDRAVEMIRSKANLPANQKIALVPYPPHRTLIEVLMNRSDQPSLAEMKINALLAKVPGGRWIRPILEGGTLALMPYSVEVQ
jgi:protease-4